MMIPIPVPIPAKNGITTTLCRGACGESGGTRFFAGRFKIAEEGRPAAAPVSTTVIKGVLAKIMPGNSDILNLRRW